MCELKYYVYKKANIAGGNGELKAAFVDENDALSYKELLTNVNRSAGYNDKFYVKDNS